VKAVLLLFPCRGELAEARKKEEEDGQGKFEGKVWWIKQTVFLLLAITGVWA
jgi:ubiquitin carboxyl-terminal hydrolase L3